VLRSQIHDPNVFDIRDEIAAAVVTSLKANYRPRRTLDARNSVRGMRTAYLR
jgi:hypothetical protein